MRFLHGCLSVFRKARVDVWPPVMSLEGNSQGNAERVGGPPRRRQAAEGLINVRGERRAWHLGVNKSKSVSLPVYAKQERYPSCLIHAPPPPPPPPPSTSYCSSARLRKRVVLWRTNMSFSRRIVGVIVRGCVAVLCLQK